jgi:hypothetical protein
MGTQCYRRGARRHVKVALGYAYATTYPGIDAQQRQQKVQIAQHQARATRWSMLAQPRIQPYSQDARSRAQIQYRLAVEKIGCLCEDALKVGAGVHGTIPYSPADTTTDL